MKEISVIIPVYNDGARLVQCLAALSRQTLPRAAFEVIVVDNGSTQSKPFDVDQFPDVIWCMEPKPGSYAARNRGLVAASGELIAFTDSDCLPAPDWLESGVSFLRASGAAIAGGRIDFIEPVGRPLSVVEICESQIFYMTNHRRTIEESHFAVTANMFTHKFLFQKIGLFNDGLKSSGDREWVGRALACGVRLAYVETAIILHPRRSSFLELANKVKRLKGGMVQLAIKQPSIEQLSYALRYTPFDFRLYRVPFRTRKLGSIAMKIQACWILAALAFLGLTETLRVSLGGASYRGA